MRGDFDHDGWDRSSSDRGRVVDLASAALLRLGPAAAISICFLYLIWDRLDGVTFESIAADLAAISDGALLIAPVCAAAGLAAAALYDGLALAALNARSGRRFHIPWPRLARGGFAGGVFARSLGLGVLASAVARWRIYRANGFGLKQASVLSLIATLGYAGGGITFAAMLALFAADDLAGSVGGSADGIRIAAFATLTVVVSIAALRTADGRTLGQAMGSLGLFSVVAAVDIGCAALVFWLVLPDQSVPDFATLAAIVAIAAIAGHLSSAPGGVGPFEAIMLACLPAAPPSAVVAAILVYRLLFFVLPTVPAVALAALASRPPVVALSTREELRDRVDWAIDVSDDPMGDLARLGDKRIYQPRHLSGFAMYGVSGRIWLMLGDPIGPQSEWAALIDGLAAEARAAGGALAAYKATERSAPLWRDRGMSLAVHGEEAILSTSDFSIDGAGKRGLRRKLRNVERSGAVIRRHPPGEAPMDALADVADTWAIALRGLEQGFSSGAWRPQYVRAQEIFSMWRDGAPVAFASCRRSGDGRAWTLDLVRRTGDAPNGAIQALVVAAIEAAAEAGADRFSLDMAPLSGFEGRRDLFAIVGSWFYRRFGDRYGLHGLRRFKAAFEPNWAPRYLVAPGPLAMAEAAIAARRLVRGDAPLDWATPRAPRLELIGHRAPAEAVPTTRARPALDPERRRA